MFTLVRFWELKILSGCIEPPQRARSSFGVIVGSWARGDDDGIVTCSPSDDYLRDRLEIRQAVNKVQIVFNAPSIVKRVFFYKDQGPKAFRDPSNSERSRD